MVQLEKTSKLASDFQIYKILNGMWQVSGGHGQIDQKTAVEQMLQYHNAGFTTWDMADIYAPAEEFLGEFRKLLNPEELTKSQALTKFVPNPGPMTRSIVEHYIEQSIKKMNVSSIDLLQFHWWDYNDTSYLDALTHLTKLQENGKIKHLGLTNFDTRRIEIMIEKGFKLVSNQVQYSILDQRPQVKMVPFCKKHDIKLLSYGTLLGGFFSEKYLEKPEPTRADLDTLSLQKYKNMIDSWGGWNLFQELLLVLDQIATKHKVGIANVATRFILERPCVAGTIIGARLGITQHITENQKTFGFCLDENDYSKITEVTSKANNLFDTIGDCGDEYR
jgi:aryl-alcohol dehydrogenase-like predicted oxidoreductase